MPDDDLAALYTLCEVFCLPVAVRGVRVAAAGGDERWRAVDHLEGLESPEVAGDAAVYVDPLSVDEVLAALVQLLRSPSEREALSARARQNAAAFSWDRTADKTLRLLAALDRRETT